MDKMSKNNTNLQFKDIYQWGLGRDDVDVIILHALNSAIYELEEFFNYGRKRQAIGSRI